MGLGITLIVLGYLIRIPYKRRYHWFFIAFVAILALQRFVHTAPSTAETPEAYFAGPWIWWQNMLGNSIQMTLLFTSIIYYINPKLSRAQKYVVMGAFAFCGVQWTMIIVDPATFYKEPVRLTLTGYVTSAGYFTQYFSPSGVNVFILFFTILTVSLLVRFYRSQRSIIIKGQTRYLIAGISLISGGWLSFSLTRQLLLPFNLNPYIVTVGAAIILIGFRKHGFFSIIPTEEEQSTEPIKHKLKDGSTYVSIEVAPKNFFEAFADLTRHKYQGLCMSRTFPEKIRQIYGLKTTPILWLTEDKSDNAIDPTDLNGLWLTVRSFLQTTKHPVLMLHGMEYLVSINGFTPVSRLVTRMSDLIEKKDGVLLIPTVQGSLTEEQLKLLRANCPSFQRLDIQKTPDTITSPNLPQNQESKPHLAVSEAPTGLHTIEPHQNIQFESEDATRAFRFLTRAFLKDYMINRVLVESAGWRTSLEIARGAGLPTSKTYGNSGKPGSALTELLKRGLIETRWVAGQRGRGGTIMKVRINYGNPYVKAEIDRSALQP
ncbi:MAG: DUF835 domain-containing protein [Thaumarchaeota archaeon]|nr:DUF835 domain-containing protein [Nitrososphaerota archaeon]